MPDVEKDAGREWPTCATYPNLGCVCRGAFMANPSSGSCIRKRTGDLSPVVRAVAPASAEIGAPVYVPCTDGWWEPSEDPAWYRMVEPCDETCHHPVHAFNPERRKHLEEAAWILLNVGSIEGGQR